MKKTLLLLATVFAFTIGASAQGTIENVEIYLDDFGSPIYLEHHEHNDTTKTFCYIYGAFKTREEYAEWSWNIYDDSGFRTSEEPEIWGDFFNNGGYIEVTVRDEDGNVGHDIAYMSINDHADFMEIRGEINEEGHYTLKWNARPQDDIMVVYIKNENGTWWPLDDITFYDYEHDSWTDTLHYVNENLLYHYQVRLYDTCFHGAPITFFETIFAKIIEGGVTPQIKIRTSQDVCTVGLLGRNDEQEELHQLIGDDGLPVLFQTSSSTTFYNLNDTNYKYIYAGLYGILNGETALMCLSNVVLNPLDPYGEDESTASSLRVYPNPTSGALTLEAEGHVAICNAIGQVVKELEVSGTTTVELPSGMYFVKTGNRTEKVVVL